VSLPKGSTRKSRDILAKHSASTFYTELSYFLDLNIKYNLVTVQMDKVEQKKSVFDRLKPHDIEMADSTSNDSIVKVGKVSSSIFNRLGGFEEVKKTVNRSSIAFSGILKNSPTKQVA